MLHGQIVAADGEFMDELHHVLSAAETDMTIFYRRLATLPADLEGDDAEVTAPLADAYYVPDQLTPEVTARVAASTCFTASAAST